MRLSFTQRDRGAELRLEVPEEGRRVSAERALVVEGHQHRSAGLGELDVHLGGAGVLAQDLAKSLGSRRGDLTERQGEHDRPARTFLDVGDGQLLGEDRDGVVAGTHSPLDDPCWASIVE